MTRYFKGGIAVFLVFDSDKKYDLSCYFDMSLYELYNNGYMIKQDVLNNYFKYLYYEIMNKLDKPLLSDSILNSDSYILECDISDILDSNIILRSDFKYRYSFTSKYFDLDICYIFDKDFTLKIGLLPIIWYPYDTFLSNDNCLCLRDAFIKNITSILRGALWFTII